MRSGTFTLISGVLRFFCFDLGTRRGQTDGRIAACLLGRPHSKSQSVV